MPAIMNNRGHFHVCTPLRSRKAYFDCAALTFAQRAR